MRLRQSPQLLLCLLVPCLYVVTAFVSSEETVPSADGKELGPPPELTSSSASKAGVDGIGTIDAPVDGKDGRPHLGPFVETGAERDRKKAKENSGDVDIKKPVPEGVPTGDGANIPETNDGVMDDPHRTGPKEGTRGTEGGISEKNKDRKATHSDGAKAENKPDPPKEVPPLPHSEEESLDPKAAKDESKKNKEIGNEDKDKQKELGGLEKPADLPDKPHDLPHPVPATASKSDPLAILAPFTPSIPMLTGSSASLIQPLHSFVLSFTMIIFSEIGDKTFLIAALMAMKHPRLIVFSAAFTALIAMTILSAVLGHAVPTLVPKKYTNLLAALLFLVFGAKMLKEGYTIPLDQGVNEEMKEVEMELEEKEELARKMGRRRSSISPYILESGRMNSRKTRSSTRLPAPPDSPPSSPDGSRSPSPSRGATIMSVFAGVNNLFSLLLSPAWVQTFVMTFLGEWGDRSQIATIAMAAGQDYWWVTGGAVSGHAICTAIAVIGGRAIAGRVSLRIVTLGGGFAFLVFGIIYLIEAMYVE
ncbi:hypothetical protein BDR22DRAFT_889695 [Usnea florida]